MSEEKKNSGNISPALSFFRRISQMASAEPFFGKRLRPYFYDLPGRGLFRFSLATASMSLMRFSWFTLVALGS